MLAAPMGTAVGEMLRQARERLNWTVQDISEKVKIRTDHVVALEEGNYDVFSAPVYIRGFVRSYANVVKLNVPETLALLDQELSKTERFKEHPKLTGQSKGVVDYVMLQLSKVNWSIALPVVLLVILLLGAVIGYRIYRENRSRDPLKDLGPGLYQPKQGGEMLPVPRTNQ